MIPCVSIQKYVFVCAFISILLLVTARASPAEQERLRVIAGKDTYELGGRPLEEGSVVLERSDSLFVDSSHYQVDYFTGTLTLLDEFSPGTILLVTYSISGTPRISLSLAEMLPIIPRDSSSTEPPETGSRDPDQRQRRMDDESRPPDISATNISVTGEKTFAVQVDPDRGTRLNQSLDLNIGGSITEGTDMNVYLTDNAVPVERNGASKEIRELDRVAVSVDSRGGSATVGSYTFTLRDYDLLSVSKNLEGFSGELRGGDFSVGGSGAISSGEFMTAELAGIEGRQGPYYLKSKTGKTGIIIIAGSEKVSLDGRLLEKGTRGDYIINYNEGTVTFTDRNVISAYSRIEVEYEYASSNYKKSFLATQGAVELGEKTTVRGFLTRERDMDSSPLGGAFSESDMAILAQADTDDEVLLPGGRHVEPGEGDYALVDDDVGGDYYEYVGAGKGEYIVEFSRVEQGEGDYIRDPATARFIHVGAGEGDYIAARMVQPPRSSVTGGAGFRFDDQAGMRINGEGYVSSTDGNTYAPGSAERDAVAFTIGGNLSDRPVRLGETELGTYSLDLTERYIGDGFDASGRIYDVDFSRHWGVSTIRNGARENITTVSAGYAWNERVDVESELGFLDRGNGESSRRNLLRAATQPFTGSNFHLERETSTFGSLLEAGHVGRGEINRIETGAKQTVGRWTASLVDESETRIDPGRWLQEWDGSRRNTLTASVNGKIGRSFDLTLSAEREHGDRQNQGVWSEWLKAVQGDVSVKYRGEGARSVSAHLAQRRTNYVQGSGERFATTVGRLEYFDAPPSGRHRTQISYELTNTSRVAGRVAFVPERSEYEGEYLEDGTYVGTDEGTHTREIIPGSDVGERTMRVSLSGVQSLDLGFIAPDAMSLSDLTLTSTFRFVEENNALSDRGLYAFTSNKRFSPDHSIYSENSLREELEARWKAKGIVMRLEYSLNDLMDNRFENLTSGSNRSHLLMNVRSVSASGLELGFEIGSGREGRILANRRDRIGSLTLAGDIGYQMNRHLRLTLGATGEKRTLDADEGVRVIEISPSVTHFFSSHGRMQLRLELAQASGRVDDYYTAIWLLRGREFGLNTNVQVEGEYRVGKSFLFLSRLSFKKLAGSQRTRLGGNTELRYLF